MTKKLTLIALLAMVAVLPFTPALRADSGGWSSITASAAWDYGTYRVERLAFASDATAPFSLGDAAFVAEPVDSCKPSDCDRYDFYLLKDGMKVLLSNVPAEAMDAKRFNKNDGRFVYITQTDTEGDHYAVMERSLEDGTSTTLASDVFLNGAVSVDALADGDDLYFNPSFNYTGTEDVGQSGVYFWNVAEQKAYIIGTHWELRDESLEDAQDGIALVKMTFDDGYKQLWFGDTHNVDYLGMTREAIPGTWTEPSGDIVGAHFLSNGSIEYFQYFVRYTYNPATDTEPVKHEDNLLSWYVPTEDAYQVVGNRMAWIDADQNLYVSDDGVVTKVGYAYAGQFLLESDRVFFASTASTGTEYDFATKTSVSTPFWVTDSQDDVLVGTDATGNVWYKDDNGNAMKLGFGSAPIVSDDSHAYWQGTDGSIYEATVLTTATADTSLRAMKLSTEKTVYLIDGTSRYAIPSEAVYLSWFESWASVETVSSTTLNAYTSAGSAKFAPGTKVKYENDPKVYVVGDDGKLHWIVSQTVAYNIYGTTWNQDIVSVKLQDMLDYASGDSIQTEGDIESI